MSGSQPNGSTGSGRRSSLNRHSTGFVQPPHSSAAIRRSGLPRSAGAEQAISRISETREDISLLVELAVESRAIDLYIGVSIGEAAHSLRRGHVAENPDPGSARPLEGADSGCRAPAGSEHRVEHEKVPLGDIA